MLRIGKNIKNQESLEVNCEVIDNESDKFCLILNGNSEMGVGVSNVSNIDAICKYKKLINKNC